jgi:hypothetical protein
VNDLARITICSEIPIIRQKNLKDITILLSINNEVNVQHSYALPLYLNIRPEKKRGREQYTPLPPQHLYPQGEYLYKDVPDRCSMMRKMIV